MPRGVFLSVEGGEGVGKSTQMRALADALTARGKTVTVTREPGGTPGAEAIRTLLLSGAGDRWTAEAEALLFAAARADHVARLIRPAIDRGDWVLCDRYIDSSRAYQGAGSALGDDAIMALHQIGSAGLLPDRTLVLDLDPETAAARVRARSGDADDRIGARDAAFHADVRAAFHRFAAQEPARVRLIDAGGAAQDVTARLIDAVRDLL